MKVIVCPGGYAMPVKRGPFKILGFNAPVYSTGEASRLTFVDDDTRQTPDSLQLNIISDSISKNNPIIDEKGIAGSVGNLAVMFPEPYRVTRGLNVVNATNLIPGRICVFIE